MGITLYAFVYGQLPFKDLNLWTLYNKIKNSPLIFPSSPCISDDLTELITLMLNKDPTKRITLPEIKVLTAWMIHFIDSAYMDHLETNCI